MGRNSRLVNPDEGPLQSFAHDLRKLREQAGNPTYRALAKTAGFSASTLGEAAGGVRRPSLDVTLAFAGACGGDVEAWQERWYQLDELLSAGSGQPSQSNQPSRQVERPDPAGPATTTVEAASSDPSPSADPADPATRLRFRRSLIAGLTVAVVSVLVLAAALEGSGRSGTPVAAVSASGCAAPGAKGRFSGNTRGSGARVRAGASMADAVLRTIPANCGLEFTGYCLGDVVPDPLGGTPDMRWFELVGGGVVSSAVVHGNPDGQQPRHLRPARDRHPRVDRGLRHAAVQPDRPGRLRLLGVAADRDGRRRHARLRAGVVGAPARIRRAGRGRGRGAAAADRRSGLLRRSGSDGRDGPRVGQHHRSGQRHAAGPDQRGARRGGGRGLLVPAPVSSKRPSPVRAEPAPLLEPIEQRQGRGDHDRGHERDA
jgi:hypothetical protein